MIEILRSLAHGVGNMTYGEPDATDAVSAADVVRWAVEEIERLREERRWISVGERLLCDEEWVDVAGEWGEFIGCHDGEQWTNCNEDQLPNVTHWRKRTPGPEGDANE
jgi:hypothetical protein